MKTLGGKFINLVSPQKYPNLIRKKIMSKKDSDQCNSKPSVAFAHLGCEKNRVDTEHMIGLLDNAGYSVSNDESDAELVVVNTCSFIQEAREESVRKLIDLAAKGKKLIIAGCLAQHFQNELLDSLPEAKAVVGTGDYQHIVDVLSQVVAGKKVNRVSTEPTFVGDENLPRYRTTNQAVAYLKIAEGCDYQCAFCIIPKLRGKQRSRPIESIVAEAHSLAKQGVKELILISQISTNYGHDLYGKPSLAELLRSLGEVDIPWIRVHYAYPTGLTKEVLTAYKEVSNVVPYLDLPLQHSHPEVLRLMNRPWQAGVNTKIMEQIREELPNSILRTTLIVGFPGETESQFEHLASFISSQRFDHVGVFTFSAEEGTAAANLPNQISFETAQARKDKIISIQQPISEALNHNWVGRTVDVLIEKECLETGKMTGRCERFAPEVDGEVVIDPPEPNLQVRPGEMIPALITGASVYDLSAQAVGIKHMVKQAIGLN